MEPTSKVRGIAHDFDVAKITFRGVPDRPGIAAAIFGQLADAHVSVDTIVQNSSLENLTDLTFTVGQSGPSSAHWRSRGRSPPRSAAAVWRPTLSSVKVSIVGTGMQNTPGYAALMFPHPVRFAASTSS